MGWRIRCTVKYILLVAVRALPVPSIPVLQHFHNTSPLHNFVIKESRRAVTADSAIEKQ